MNYIENIYICIAAPLLITVLCMRETHRQTTLFFLVGMTTCLASAYISSFLAAVYGLGRIIASVEITPVVEEIMKLFPILFFLLVFEPRRREVAGSMLMTAAGFATFENICYLTAHGAENPLHMLIRGFGSGSMHVVCGMMAAAGLLYIWDKLWLRLAGTVGLLSLAICYHAIFNMLVSQTGMAARVGYMIPLITVPLVLIFAGKQLKKI